jgi:hypothetical protein
MLARLALLLVVAVCVVCVAAESLRKDVDNVPLDNVKGAKIMERLHRAGERSKNNEGHLLNNFVNHEAIRESIAQGKAHGRNLKVSALHSDTHHLHSDTLHSDTHV